MTALTAYGTNTAASTIATAATLVTSIGGTNLGVNTRLGTATGYGELLPLGTTNAWAAAGGMSAPTGKGFLLDSTLLEGQTIIAGTWTPTFRIKISVGTCTADVYCRFWVRSSGGTYTQIGSALVQSAVAVTTTSTTYTLTGASELATLFNVGDKLYVDWWANVTANSSGSGTADLGFSVSNSTTVGSATANQVVTPGYVVAGTANVVSNATLGAAAQVVAVANVQANSALNATNAVVQAPANVQGNSLAQVASAIMLSTASIVANSAMGASAVVQGPASVQSNSALAQAGARVNAPASLIANAILSGTGSVIVAVAPHPGSATLSDHQVA